VSYGSRYHDGDVCDQCGCTVPWNRMRVHANWHRLQDQRSERVEVLRRQMKFVKDAVDDVIEILGRTGSPESWDAAMKLYDRAWEKISTVDSEGSAQ
jgi:hypothetical protein